MSKDMGASAKADRAAGLRPQPPAASSQSSIPSADLIKRVRETWPIYPELGPVTHGQRQLLHELCDRLESPNHASERLTLGRDWFLWAFDTAMRDAVAQHGDAARLAAYTARISFDRTLPNGLQAVVRDSGSDRNGEDSRSEAECEASQSGLSASEGIAQTPHFPSENPS